MKINTEQVKQSINIVDYINQYVHLKKNGKSYVACCPFHSEKTPSFTVDEQKQFYYCFGCGATGDVIKFAQEYSGLDFVDACQSIAGNLVLEDNYEKPKQRLYYPEFDKRLTSDVCAEYLAKSDRLIPIVDYDGELVNLYNPINSKFLAKGVSHHAYSVYTHEKPINENQFICVDYDDAIDLSSELNASIHIAYSSYNMQLICNHKPHLTPIIKLDDTLAYRLQDFGSWYEYTCDKQLIKHDIGQGFYYE